MVRVTVPMPGRPYDVTIGTDVIATAADHLPALSEAGQAFVVADRSVADVWFAPLAASLARRALQTVLLAVPSGEDAKTLQVHQTLLHQLASRSAHRDDLVVALGGTPVRSAADFESAIRTRRPGTEVPITFERRGQRITATLRLIEDPRQELVPAEAAGQSLTDAQRRFREAWLSLR